MADFIGIDTRGIPELARLLQDLPEEARDTIIDDVSKYLLNVLRQYPPKNYITRTAAYGKPFFTERQRRWFFAALADGSINVPYNRTQGLRKAWRQELRGEQSFLINDAKGAEWVIGENQSRHEAMVGWKQVTQVMDERAEEIGRRGEAAAQKAIRKLGG